MPLSANATKKAIFAKAWDSFVYFAAKRIGAWLKFIFNSRVSGRSQIEYANKRTISLSITLFAIMPL